MSFFGTAPHVRIDINLTGTEGRRFKTTTLEDGSQQRAYIFSSGEEVAGEVRATVAAGKRFDHVGIKIELKGVVDIAGEKPVVHEFTSIVKELAVAGGITGAGAPMRFCFPRVDMPYESYEGVQGSVRYFLRVTVSKGGYSGGTVVKELDFLGQNVDQSAVSPPVDAAVKLEVGIEDCLHIEFEYDRTRYHLSDVVTGRVHFLLVRIRIKFMELAVIRKETVNGGGGGLPTNDSQTLTRFEIMDGCPVRGEVLPIRMHLGPLDLTPSVSGVANGMLTVRYFLNLVLVDEEDRRYFKQQEISMYRKELGGQLAPGDGLGGGSKAAAGGAGASASALLTQPSVMKL